MATGDPLTMLLGADGNRLKSLEMNVQNGRMAGQVSASAQLATVDNLENKRIHCYAALAACDALLLSAGFLLSNLIYLGSWRATHGLTMLGILLPIYLWTAVVNGAYNGHVLRAPQIGVFKAVRALAFAGAALLIIAYSFKVGEVFSRIIFWLGILISMVLIVAGRFALSRRLIAHLGGTPFSTIVLVDNVEWSSLHHDIVVHADRIGFDPCTNDSLQYHNLAKIIAHADRVLVACHDDRVAAWAHVLKCMAVDGEIITSDTDRIGMIGVSRHAGRQTLVVSAGPLHLRDRTLKRIFDIVTSALALILLLPLFVAVAIAVRLESPGPILFRQQRIGRDNTLFMMFKFRSMYHDRCDATASVLTKRGDSRVTRVGEFLRRNSIDELPQLLNVLRGDMSMVGPRPHALSARAAERLYWEIDERYRHRHAVKPGVTGLAQIRGFRGATVSTSDLTNRLASDLEYLRDWSMSRDILILLRTLFVIRHDNAF